MAVLCPGMVGFSSLEMCKQALAHLACHRGCPKYCDLDWRGWKWKCRSFSRAWLFATPWTTAHQAPPSRGFSRQEYWRGLPFSSPGHFPDPVIKRGSPALQADSTIWATRKGLKRVGGLKDLTPKAPFHPGNILVLHFTYELYWEMDPVFGILFRGRYNGVFSFRFKWKL